MSEHEDDLKRALAENNRFKAEKADLLKKQSTAEFSGRLKFAERIMYAYLLGCAILGVPVLNVFILSGDLKTLITCLLVLVVVYETTVLLKLWYVVAGTKLSVLKEMKLLRLEVSQLSLAAAHGETVDVTADKYDPAQGLSKIERRLWLVGIAVIAMILGGLSSGGFAWFAGESSKVEDDTLVTLNADGSAVSATDIVQTKLGVAAPIAGMFSPSSFSFYAPPSRKMSWFDSQGRKLNFTTKLEGSHTCYDIQCPKRNLSDGRLAYTYVMEIPDAAKQTDGVWTYENDICYGCKQNRFSATVLLPEGAELVSAEPRPTLELTSNGRRAVRLQGDRGMNEKFAYKLSYRLREKTVTNKSGSTGS